MLDNLVKGQAFNEITAINEQGSPVTVEVSSETAVVLKVNINALKEHFGGEEGEPVMQIRADSIMKNNWLRMKTQFLAYMDKDKLT